MTDHFFTVDISEKFIKVVDAKKTNDLIEISSIGKIDSRSDFYPSEIEKTMSEQASSLNKLITSLKITKKNVNVIIPDSLTYNQILTMPSLNEKELISAIKYQADQFIPMPIEETNIDLEIIQEYKEEKKILILIVAAEKKLIEKIQTTVELAGLIPESIESELSANARFFEEINKNITDQRNRHNFVLINFGINSSNISYFDQDKFSLKESHNIALGYQLFLKEIKVNTNTDDKKSAEILQNFSIDHPSSFPVETIISPLLKEFIIEVRRFIGAKKPNAVYFINHVSYFPSLPMLIQKELSLPASLFNPYPVLKKIPLIDNLKIELPLYISTIGGNLR